VYLLVFYLYFFLGILIFKGLTARHLDKLVSGERVKVPSCLKVMVALLVVAVYQYTKTPLQEQDFATSCSQSPSSQSQHMACRIHGNKQLN
jgi:hypothetical protein